MIIRLSIEKNKYKLFKGDEQYIKSWEKSRWVPGNKRNNYKGYVQTWTITDAYHRLPEILAQLPDANYSLYVITQDEQRKDTRQQRHDINKIPVQLSGLKKTNILNYLTKKLKPEIETVLNAVKQLANNITIDNSQDIISQMQIKLKELDLLKTNIEYANLIVDNIFYGETGTLQDIMNKKSSNNSWRKADYNKFIALLQQGILNAKEIYSNIK